MANQAAERRVVLFEGRVQGVFFRDTTRRLAQPREVTGYVRNLPDGRVELVAEGTAQEVDALLLAIRREYRDNIRGEQTDTRPATGEFSSFEIRH